jgi:hypothetical protein
LPAPEILRLARLLAWSQFPSAYRPSASHRRQTCPAPSQMRRAILETALRSFRPFQTRYGGRAPVHKYGTRKLTRLVDASGCQRHKLERIGFSTQQFRATSYLPSATDLVLFRRRDGARPLRVISGHFGSGSGKSTLLLKADMSGAEIDVGYVPEADTHGTTQNSRDHKGRCGAAPGRRRQNRVRTAIPMLNAAAVVANHACFRHQPSFLASRRLRRISRAKAFLRGLNSLGSRLLRSSIDQPSPGRQ